MDTEAEEAHDAIQQVEAESLLVYVDKLLGCLPDIDPHRLEEPDATTLAIKGSPQEVQGVIRSMMGFAHPGQVSLRLTLNREGWHVALDVHS